MDCSANRRGWARNFVENEIMGAELHEFIDKIHEAMPLIGVSAVGAGVDCMSKMRDRRKKFKWWEYVLTFFIGMSLGWMAGNVAVLSGAPPWISTGIASCAAILNVRLVEFAWRQTMISIRRRLGNDEN